jgi:hypothetical protein
MMMDPSLHRAFIVVVVVVLDSFYSINRCAIFGGVTGTVAAANLGVVQRSPVVDSVAVGLKTPRHHQQLDLKLLLAGSVASMVTSCMINRFTGS